MKVAVEAVHSTNGKVTVLTSRDGRTVTQRQYKLALARLGAVDDELRIAPVAPTPSQTVELVVMDGTRARTILN